MPLDARILTLAPGTVFIETGTWDGAGVALALAAGFERIYSVEIDAERFLAARQRFAGERRVKLYHGRSADCLPDMIRAAGGPATFWLDAHMAGVTPIMDELAVIRAAGSPAHKLLIDDMRIFGNPWPMQKSDVETVVRTINPAYRIFYAAGPAGYPADDIMVALP